jgi:Holliday junction resolvase RusA-like endonuclease
MTSSTCHSETFYIPLKLPGLNEYTRANRSNAYQGAEMKREAEDDISVYIRKAMQEGKLHRHNKECFLYLNWYEKDKRRDGDNIAFAVKFIQDALVSCGVFPDDSRKYIIGHHHTYYKADDYGVLVSIEEM